MPGRAERSIFIPTREIASAIQASGPIAEGTLIVLPYRIDENGAQYRDCDLTLPKELRSGGVAANFLHASENRSFVSEFSGSIAYVIAFGIASNMTWDAAKVALQYLYYQARRLAKVGEDPVLRLNIARIKRDGVTIEGVSLEAPATEEFVLDFLRVLTGDDASGTGQSDHD